jgi:hypothetical protein
MKTEFETSNSKITKQQFYEKQDYFSPEIEVQQVQLENSIAADSGTVTPPSTPDVGDWEDGGNNNGDISL